MFTFLLVLVLIFVVALIVIKFMDLSRKFTVLETYVATVATLEDVQDIVQNERPISSRSSAMQ